MHDFCWLLSISPSNTAMHLKKSLFFITIPPLNYYHYALDTSLPTELLGNTHSDDGGDYSESSILLRTCQNAIIGSKTVELNWWNCTRKNIHLPIKLPFHKTTTSIYLPAHTPHQYYTCKVSYVVDCCVYFYFYQVQLPQSWHFFCSTPLATIHSTHFFLPSAACWLLYWSQTLIVIIYITQSMIRWIGGIINPWSDQLLFDGSRRWQQKCVIFGADDGQWWQKSAPSSALMAADHGDESASSLALMAADDGDKRHHHWRCLAADDGDESASSLLSVLKAANNGDTHVLSLALMEANDGN